MLDSIPQLLFLFFLTLLSAVQLKELLSPGGVERDISESRGKRALHYMVRYVYPRARDFDHATGGTRLGEY